MKIEYKSKGQLAKEWLVQFLKSRKGKAFSTDVIQRAIHDGHCLITLRREAKKITIKHRNTRPNVKASKWVWELKNNKE